MEKLVTEESTMCQKLTSIDFVIRRDVFKNIYSFVEERTVKQNLLTIMKNLQPKYCFKHKKEDMVNTKRGHKLCQNCKSSYKTKCNSPKCKYTIEKYKSASKYMKLKTIDYLKETKTRILLTSNLSRHC